MSVKTLVASGRTKRTGGNNLVPIEFEILFEPPAKYVRVDEFPAENMDPTSAGFNGDALIQIPPPPAAPAGAAGPGRCSWRACHGAGPAAAAPGGPPTRLGARPGAPTRSAGCVPPPGGRCAGAPGAAVAPGAMPAGAMPGGGRGPVMDPRRARLNAVKHDYARLALGLFASSTGYPLTYTWAAIAEAPQGRADVIDIKGEGNFAPACSSAATRAFPSW